LGTGRKGYAGGVSSEIEPVDGVRSCKIADALEVVGDRWSLLIIREIAYGVRRFNDIRIRTGAPRQILTARLRKLEAEGVISRHQYSERPPRDEYVLTDAGQAVVPVLRALRRWGEKYVPDRAPDATA
jgi:DNA-binding HxlR family transcriptional regulator